MDFSIREHVVRIQIIELSGRLEAFTVAPLREALDKLLNEGAANFVVDLTNVSFMDSAGLAGLVSLLKRSRLANGTTVLVRPVDPQAYRILSLTSFDRVFTICANTDEALGTF